MSCNGLETSLPPSGIQMRTSAIEKVMAGQLTLHCDSRFKRPQESAVEPQINEEGRQWPLMVTFPQQHDSLNCHRKSINVARIDNDHSVIQILHFKKTIKNQHHDIRNRKPLKNGGRHLFFNKLLLSSLNGVNKKCQILK